MKTALLVSGALLALAWGGSGCAAGSISSAPKPGVTAAESDVFVVYREKGSPQNHFAPSGWMGDTGDLKLDDANREQPAEGDTCIKITYTAKGSKGAGWAGIYWQHPPNNWGNRPGGYDLRGKSRLVFSAHGAKGGEVISEFKVGGISGEFADTDVAAMGPVTLTPHWSTYTIQLDDKDLSRISGGFSFVLSKDNNPNGAVFFIDDIRYEK